MDLQTYSDEAIKTAIFTPEVGLIYPALKLGGEVGEFLEAWHDYFHNNKRLDKNVAKELGDILWYVNACALKLGYKLVGLKEDSGGVPQHLTLPMLTGRFQEAVGKTIRDHNGIPTEELDSIMYSSLAWIIAKIDDLASMIGFTLEEIADLNMKKLLDRKDRGVIHGSGDNR